jgi:hypothetical protein
MPKKFNISEKIFVLQRENLQLVQKSMNKEDRYSHLVPMDLLLCKLSPCLRHTSTQSIVIKDNKNDCIVWGGSTVTRSTDIVMNQVTPVAQEAPVTFGHVKKPDLHGHLQHTHEISKCNNSSWSSRC